MSYSTKPSRHTKLLFGFRMGLVMVAGQVASPATYASIERHSIESVVLDETRHVLVRLPDDIRADDSYPVLYLLDGMENMLLCSGIIQNLSRAERIPEMIVIGIENNRRFYDLTTHDAEFEGPDCGGAPQFLEFLSQELIPWVEGQLPAADYRILAGHSIGGVLQFEALLRNPHLFDAHLVFSPSLWWKNGTIPATVDSALALPTVRSISSTENDAPLLYLSLADEEIRLPESQMRTGFADLERVLLDQDVLRWKSDRYDRQNHISTLISSLQSGLEFVFDRWAMGAYLEGGDIAGLRSHVDGLQRDYPFSVHPSSDWDFASACRKLTSSGQPELAAVHLEWGRSHFPQSLVIHNFLGEAYEASGNNEAALANYTRSLEIAVQSRSPMLGWIERRIDAVGASPGN